MREIQIMKLSLLLLSTLAFIVQGCGSGTLSTSNPPTLTFVSSNLEQYGELIPVNIANIQIQVEEDINPVSIGNENVHIMPGKGHTSTDQSLLDGDQSTTHPVESADPSSKFDTVEGNVWFDATNKTINFQPKRPLSAGVTYHLRIQNVELADGRKVDIKTPPEGTETGVIEFSFSTSHIHEILEIRYDKDGNETSYVSFNVQNNTRTTRYQYDKLKKRTLTLEYNSTLPAPSTRVAKKVFRDGENNIAYYDYDFVENDVVIAEVRFKNPGDDGLWGTDDDLASSWSKRNLSHISHSVTKNYMLENRSVMVPWTGVDSPGFVLRTTYLEEHGGANFGHRNIFYRDLGANGEIDIDPITNELTVIDDNISLWYKRDFLDGKRIRSWSLKGVSSDTVVGGEGLDNTLFTNDDVATGLTIYEYYPANGTSTAGLLKRTTNYYKTGFAYPLNEWLIDDINNLVRADAPERSYNVYLYDAFGNRTENISYSPGPDGIIASETELAQGTADDYITRRVKFSTSPTITGGVELGLL